MCKYPITLWRLDGIKGGWFSRVSLLAQLPQVLSALLMHHLFSNNEQEKPSMLLNARMFGQYFCDSLHVVSRWHGLTLDGTPVEGASYYVLST